ncbi:MAG TPA: serine/threonine-protein kinase [Polyangiaceae bacterium]|nr:serine/threonine-protein kinase [Polyangiaceae bacterium]
MSAVSRPDLLDRSGELIGGRYELVSLIDKGGQGAVYRAFDHRDQDQVAIKVLNDASGQQPEWRERMFREAHAMTALSGTAAVRVFDQQWTQDGALCLVMELLQGLPLDAFLKAVERAGQTVPRELVIQLLGPIVDTLELAHDQGILHRDLKPENIFVLEPLGEGGVKLLDFGFAKFIRLKSVTAAGFIAGSPSYIAPESWRGDPEKLDRRIDVYALAAVIFRALAGRPPFVSEDLRELLRLATTGERPSLHALRPDLPSEVDDWAYQALAIEPEHRFFRIRALWNAFQESTSPR